ncbi:hypothetical protein B9Y74_08995 [Stenotrophomonas maltophilia]|nr:hypothetical protein [Stenotrophomonas maltophilia]PJL50176.1 hypothetical protein B9Y74_08995 [Stenotrophomonas maltophilia]
MLRKRPNAQPPAAGPGPGGGLAAPPATGPTPPSHGNPAFAVAVEVAGQRPALPQVQGCKPCRTTP